MVSQKVLQWRSLAIHWAERTSVPEAFILAIIQMESGGNPKAKRYEPEYQRKYFASAKFEEIQRVARISPQEVATSYGLMQLMPMTAWGYLSTVDKSTSLITALHNQTCESHSCL